MPRSQTSTPDWVKREHRREIRFWVSLGVAILAIAAATWAVVKNGEQDRQITQVQHSACEVDAGGRECQRSKRESSRAANLATTCIAFWKAGYPCPKPDSRAAQRQLQMNSKGVQSLELPKTDEPSQENTPSVTHQSPGIGQVVGSPQAPSTPHNGSNTPSAPKPTEPTSVPPSRQPPSSHAEQSTEGAEPPASEPPAPTPSGLIGSPGGLVGEVVCGLNRLILPVVCGE